MMRAPLHLGLVLALAACGNNDQADNTQNVGENLTAESIVSNDVTAIDAVTGDEANMAADVDLNYGGLDQNVAAGVNETAPKPARPAPAKRAPSLESNNVANTAANTATNTD